VKFHYINFNNLGLKLSNSPPPHQTQETTPAYSPPSPPPLFDVKNLMKFNQKKKKQNL